MASFKAIELNIQTGTPTGRVEYYTAKNKKEAGRKLLYMRKLKSKRCRLGPTGLVVACGVTAWVLSRKKA